VASATSSQLQSPSSNFQSPAANLQHPAPSPITRAHSVQIIHRSLYAHCCSIKYLPEGTHTIYTWCIFEIWNMKMKKEKEKGRVSWGKSNQRPLPHPLISNLHPPTSNVHHP
jgi:hypothetical protein